jgi:16S rRNA processing protein RimM
MAGGRAAPKDGSQDRANRVCLGIVTGPHGVRGEVKIKSFTDLPEDVAAYGPLEDETGTRSFSLTVTGQAKGAVRARLAGVYDRDQAAALKGTKLYATRGDLPELPTDEYYHSDLVGLLVERESGEVIGQVTAAHDFGGGDLIEVTLAGSGAEVLLPFTKELVPRVDITAGRLVVTGIEGFVEEESGPSRA